MFRVGLLGPESTGKSSLGKELHTRYNYVYVEEYARTYVEQLGRPYTFNDVATIAAQQIKEQSIDYGEHIVLYDTELIITKIWFTFRYGYCPKSIDDATLNQPLDLFLLLTPDIAGEPDPVRENLDKREYLFNLYLQEVQQTGKPYAIISGSGQARIESAHQAILQAFNKHTNNPASTNASNTFFQ